MPLAPVRAAAHSCVAALASRYALRRLDFKQQGQRRERTLDTVDRIADQGLPRGYDITTVQNLGVDALTRLNPGLFRAIKLLASDLKLSEPHTAVRTPTPSGRIVEMAPGRSAFRIVP